MIVPMEKVTLLCQRSRQAESLTRLRSLGVLHVQPLASPDMDGVDEARERLDHVLHALAVLPAPRPGSRLSGRTAAEVLAEARSAVERHLALEAQREALLDEQHALAPFGNFEPDAVRALARQGIGVRFFYAPSRRHLPALDGAVLRVLHQDKGGVWFAVIARGEIEVPAEELPLPDRSLAQVRRELEAGARDLAVTADVLNRLAADRPLLEREARDLEARVRFLEVQAGMGAAGPIVYLRGFCPRPALSGLREEARAAGWGLLVEAPADDDPVPTLLQTARWARPIRAVFDLLGILPGYREADVSPVFLVFFTLFFAMLIGDAVYGLLFLGLTALMQRRWKSAPPLVIPLLRLLSAGTLVWGVLTGSYLGLQGLPAPLSRLKIDWLADGDNLIRFCFLVGALHLTVAHGWSAILQRRHLTALSQLGWIGMVWTMYFLAGFFVIERPLPPGLAWLFAVSLGAIVAFMVPRRLFKTEWPSFCVLPFTVIGNFGDIVSYMRLYLIGSASTTLIVTFNQMLFGRGVTSLWAGLLGALVLFFAHALNLALNSLAVLVHGVRLNALEFSSHMGLQWSGIRYAPFAEPGPDRARTP